MRQGAQESVLPSFPSCHTHLYDVYYNVGAYLVDVQAAHLYTDISEQEYKCCGILGFPVQFTFVPREDKQMSASLEEVFSPWASALAQTAALHQPFLLYLIRSGESQLSGTLTCN